MSLLTINYKKTLGVFALALAVMFALSANPTPAYAQTASLSVRVIHASNSGGGVDGSLSSLSGQLTSRFGSYNTFQLQASHSVSVSAGNSRNVSLPNGQSMRITFEGMSGSSYRISVSLPGGSSTVTAQPGGVFFVAGPSYNGGMLIVAVSP